ncbi:MAG: secretion system protein [Variovorax sp.]|nr:MAG: secretion system protein [Variovorax sp.]
MSEAVLAAAICALLAAAAALLLWRWTTRRKARDASARFLARQIAAHGSGPSAGRATATADPWAPADAEATDLAADRRAPGGVGLPGWLQGVVAPRTLALAAAAVVVAGLAVLAIAGAVAATAAVVLLALALAFSLWLALQKRRRRMVAQLPGFIDGMVRLLTVGNATQAAFQLSAQASQRPLREPLEDAAALARAGIDLDAALHQTARHSDIEELSLLASVLGLGVRYGGRTDLLLERVAGFMRDREQAEQELVALSAETRLSAWILGLLPMAVAGMIVMTNAPYFMRMWHDATGQLMIFGAAGLQALGALLLYRLASLR